MKPIYKVSIKYGLFGSLMAIVLIVVLFYMGRHPLLIPTFFDYRILLFGVFIFFGIKEFKDYHNDGFIQFWQGIVIGVVIYMMIGLLVGVGIVVFSKIQPSFQQEYIEGTVRGLELNKDALLHAGKVTISEEEYSNQLQMLKETPTYYLGVDYFIKSCVLGFFIAIILAVIFRKSESRFSKE